MKPSLPQRKKFIAISLQIVLLIPFSSCNINLKEKLIFSINVLEDVHFFIAGAVRLSQLYDK